MRQLRVRFEPDPSLDTIEILIRAPQEDRQVATIRELLCRQEPVMLTVLDRNDNLRQLPVKEIVSASVNGKTVSLVTEEGSFRSRQSLRALEELLCAHRFVRISRYELVNLSKIVAFDFTVAGTLRLELSGGMETWASRRCISAIRRKLMGEE